MHTISGPYFDYPLGAVVGTRIGFLPHPQHVGILAPHPVWGRTVISFKPWGKVEEPPHLFTAWKPFDSVSYPGSLPWQRVVQRARDAVPMRPYNLIRFNCDHFVRFCHGVRIESPQVRAFGALVLRLLCAAAA